MKIFSFNFLIIAVVLFQQEIKAQHQIQVSLFSGYHVVNTDKISYDESTTATDWIFGGSAAFRMNIRDIPAEFTFSYSQGQSTIYYMDTADIPNPDIYDVYLRYQTIPFEALWVLPRDKNIEMLFGINIAAQHRTLILENLNMVDDRLFSLGVGLSGKMHMTFGTFSSGKGTIFGNLHARWTEFIFHDANGRNLNDYTLRHVTVSPQLGVAWGLD